MADETPSVFLATCDAGDFDRTVREGVDLSEHPDHPEGLDGDGVVRFWGVPGGSRNESHFERMREGDLVLFYEAGSYVGAGWIGTTVEDPDGWASETFWEGEPRELLYTVESFSDVDVPRAAVNRLFDYGPDYTPGGLMRVADGRVDDRVDAIKLALERLEVPA